MNYTNPDNPDNIRTIEAFDGIGIAGDVRADTVYINFLSESEDGMSSTLEGSLVVKDFNQLKNLSDILSKAVDDIEAKITR